MTPEERWQIAEDIGLLTVWDVVTLHAESGDPRAHAEEPKPIPVELRPGELLDLVSGPEEIYRSFTGPAPGLASLNYGQSFAGIPDHILVAVIRHRGGFAGFPRSPTPRKAGEKIGEDGLKVGMRISDLFGHWWDVTGIVGLDVTVVGPSGRPTVLHKESVEANCTLAEDFPRRGT